MSFGTDAINLEVRAARIAATLDARPELGALWRRLVGVSEAAASLSLEQIGVNEDDILRPPLGLSQTKSEPQSTRAARAIYRMLLRPGSMRQDPIGVFDRAVEATRLTEVIDDGGRGYIYQPIEIEVEMWQRGREIWAERVPGILREAPPPVIGALALSRLALACMPAPHPMTERLIFMAAESELRRSISLSDPVTSRRIEGLDPRVDADWVCPPSLALSKGGLRTWRPETEDGRAYLFERMSQAIGREIGRLGPLQSWSEHLASEFRGRNSRSRREDFAELLRSTPILNGRTTARALSITDRAARNLLEDAEAMGLIVQITSRYAYRLWAVPMLAEMIRDRGRPFSSVRRRSGGGEAAPAEDTPMQRPPLADDPDRDARVDRILSSIDDALAGVDELLEKYKPEHRRLD